MIDCARSIASAACRQIRFASSMMGAYERRTVSILLPQRFGEAADPLAQGCRSGSAISIVGTGEECELRGPRVAESHFASGLMRRLISRGTATTYLASERT